MSKKLTTEEFIKRSIENHGNRYDYSLVEYINFEKKVKIMCKKHGIFEQTPQGHLSGRGCFKCNGNILWTNEKFIEECKKIHKNKYDYSNTIYISQQKKVSIICPEHGQFNQWAQHHLRGVGCPICSGKNITTNSFIEKSKIIHNNKYDYSKSIYIKSSSKTIIICKEHGEFYQCPNSHLSGHGCPKCDGRNKTNDEIISEFKKIHYNKYDYDKVNYKSIKEKLIIICPVHGEFKQTYNTHLRGCGCPKCVGKHKTTESAVEEFKKIHGNKYDYSKVKYINSRKKIIIICPKHGEFIQEPNSHLQGAGCPKCNYSKGEQQIEKILKKNEIKYETQKYLEGCKNKFPLKFDFYLPIYNICIEYDGEQHFKKMRFEKNDNRLNDTILRDNIKTNFCSKNNIKLIRIKYNENIDKKLKCLINKNIS